MVNCYSVEMNAGSPSADDFQRAYRGAPPWDARHAQRALVDVSARVEGSILDVGCGTGDNAIFFAARGHTVYGVDFAPEAIERAKAKAAEAGVDVCFLVLDALALQRLPVLFDNVLDCGLFHVLGDEDRRRYVESLHCVLKPGGHLWLMCFSDREPLGNGPRRVTREELQQAFADGWTVVSIEPTRFETSPDVPAGDYSAGGPHGFLALFRRGEQEP